MTSYIKVKSVTLAERRQREKEERRDNIINAASRLFSKKGYDGVSMEEIANEVEFICIRLRKKTSKCVIFYAKIVTFKLANHYTWYSKFCIKFLNRIQMSRVTLVIG